MEVKILKEEKNIIEVSIANLTVAEVLRAYLNLDKSVVFAAWNREHPDKPPILRVETKGKDPKKAVKDAIDSISKDIGDVASDFKKA